MLVATSVDGPSGVLGRRLGTYTPTRDDRTSFRAQLEFALFDKENVDPNADGPKRATNGKRRRRESGVKTPCTPSRPPLADITRQFTTPVRASSESENKMNECGFVVVLAANLNLLRVSFLKRVEWRRSPVVPGATRSRPDAKHALTIGWLVFIALRRVS